MDDGIVEEKLCDRRLTMSKAHSFTCNFCTISFSTTVYLLEETP